MIRTMTLLGGLAVLAGCDGLETVNLVIHNDGILGVDVEVRYIETTNEYDDFQDDWVVYEREVVQTFPVDALSQKTTSYPALDLQVTITRRIDRFVLYQEILSVYDFEHEDGTLEIRVTP